MEFAANKFADEMMKTNGAFMDSALRIGAQAMKHQGEVAKHQMAMFDKWMQAGTKQVALMEDFRNPTEFAAKSGQAMTDFGQEMAVMFRQTMELQVEMASEIASAVQSELNGLMPAQAPKAKTKS